MYKAEGAVVEILDVGKDSTLRDFGGLEAQRVIVNGTDVGRIAADGISVTTDSGALVKVTLTLMPARVVLRASTAAESGDEAESQSAVRHYLSKMGI